MERAATARVAIRESNLERGGMGSKMKSAMHRSNVALATHSKGTYDNRARTEERRRLVPTRCAADDGWAAMVDLMFGEFCGL